MLVNYVFLTNRINNNWQMKKVKNNAFCVYTSTYTGAYCNMSMIKYFVSIFCMAKYV